MLSDGDIERAHPQAFDFVFGNLPAVEAAEFNQHLGGCRYCQGVVTDYSEIGQIIRQLPPHVDPPADLEDRTVAAMLQAAPGPPAEAGQRPGRDDLPTTQAYQVPQQPTPTGAPAASTEALPAAQKTLAPVTPLARRRGRRRGSARLWLAAAAAVIVTAVGVVIFRPSGGGGPALPATVVTPLHATAAAQVFGVGAAVGRATARQAGQSWTFKLVVHGLKPLPGNNFYECWWAGPGNSRPHPVLATGGSFVVGRSGSATLTMTTGVDPHQFRTMEITAESPGNGGMHGTVLLTGQTL
jgi:hypothetical protein